MLGSVQNLLLSENSERLLVPFERARIATTGSQPLWRAIGTGNGSHHGLSSIVHDRQYDRSPWSGIVILRTFK